MACGADLPPLPDGQARLRGVASMERARRLLAGLDDHRRRMLPPRFLQSIEAQAEGVDVLHQTAPPEIKAGAGGFSFLGRRNRAGAFAAPSQLDVIPAPEAAPRFPDEPPPLGESVLDAFDAPEAPEAFDLPVDPDSLDPPATPEPFDLPSAAAARFEPEPPDREDVFESPEDFAPRDEDDRESIDDLGPESFDGHSQGTLKIDPDSDEQIPAALRGMTTEPGALAVVDMSEGIDELSSSGLQAISAADLAEELPELSSSRLQAVPMPSERPLPSGADPALYEGLQRGEGPFGERGGPARLILLPEESYLPHLDVFQAVLKSALGLPPTTSARLLKRCWPSLLAAHEDPAMLRGLDARLRQAGLRTLVVANHTWARVGAPRRITGGSGRRPEPMVLRQADGTKVGVWRHELAWAALAAIDEPGAPTRWLLDVMRKRSPRPLRVEVGGFDFSMLPDIPPSPRGRVRDLLAWMSPEPWSTIPLDEGFADLQGHGITALEREVEFTEYVLLMDARERLARRGS